MLLTLAGISPFRLDLTIWALRRREKNIVDQWDGIRYIRTLAYGKETVKITATSGGTEGDPQLIITLESNADLTPRIQQDIKFLVQKSLGLAVDLRPFYILAESSEVLAPLVKQFLGSSLLVFSLSSKHW